MGSQGPMKTIKLENNYFKNKSNNLAKSLLFFFKFFRFCFKVQYSEGTAKIIDFTDQPSLEVNSIKNCLQTKWPTIEVQWLKKNKAPSLN